MGCASRVRYAAKHLFPKHQQACKMAHTLIVQQCDACATCSVDAVGCAPPFHFGDHEEYDDKLGKPSGKEKYDCDVGFQNWKNNWSVNKALWCCIQKKRGCPSTLV